MDGHETSTGYEPSPSEVEKLFERALAEEAGFRGAWASTWSWMTSFAAVLLLAWLTFTRNGWVPFLSNVDFGIHELGHLFTSWAPTPLTALAGSAAQVLAPLALAAYFAWRRDLFATSLMTAWAGSSLNNVSVYVYDATRLALPLWGDDGTGANHDWRYLLGPDVFDVLRYTDAIAYSLRAVAVALLLGACAIAVFGFLKPRLEEWHEMQAAARRAQLPVRRPRDPRALDAMGVRSVDGGDTAADTRERVG